ncbi:MAG: RNA polymerase factor sigma-54, partial [Spirochaetales bacterium]|nr:RNA polymerase factor sigma-54 [Spirochaetales bacterium]
MDGLNLSQSLKTEQTLSPQMLQSLALLPMPILELKAHIQAEIERNPALEIPDSEYDLSQFEPEKEKNLDDRMDDADSADYEDLSYYDSEASDRKQMLIENSSAPGETLKEHLMTQLGEADISERTEAIGEMLISNLDQNGFYILSLENLFENESYSKEEIKEAVSVVQSFDPAGICVPDFRASLILQAKLSGVVDQDLQIFSQIVNEYLEKLKAGKFREVSAALRIPEEDLQTFFSILKGLTPYPGQNFSSDGVTHVEPDFSIRSKNGVLVLELNRGDIPNLEITSGFEDLADNLSGQEAKEANAYIRDAVRQARTLITQVNMRFQTLYKAAAALMEIQSEFFLKGPRHLRTMTLKDIAEKIGVHETTMSRLAQSKWVDTDWGLFQLKHLFSQGVQSTSGGGENVSRNVVKDMIAEIVADNGALSAFMLESIRGLDETIQYGNGKERMKALDEKTKALSKKQSAFNRLTGTNLAAANSMILVFDTAMLALSALLYLNGEVGISGLIIPLIALLSSFGPVSALAGLGTTLQATVASGARVLEVIDETPETEDVFGKKPVSFDGA